jgi:hypothetical protein
MCRFCWPHLLCHFLGVERDLNFELRAAEACPNRDCCWQACVCTLCCPCEAVLCAHYLCCTPRKAYNSHVARSEARRAKRAGTVPSLPKKRPRDLSPPPARSPEPTATNPLVPRLPSSYGLLGKKRTMTSQQQSPFFKLSMELREKIYRAALGDYAIYIVHLRAKDGEKDGRLGCLKSKLSAGRDPLHVRPLWPQSYVNRHTPLDENFGPGLLSLLKTCKRM